MIRSGPPTPEVDPSEFDMRVARYLDVFADGDIDAYWRMQCPLMADDNGRIHGREFASDLTSTPAWARISPDLRQKIVDGAVRYLGEAEPEPSRWLGKQKIYWPAWAGYCALRLLWQERHEAFANLPDGLWRRWTPIIVGWPAQDDKDTEFRHEVMLRVRQIAASEARKAASVLLGTGSLAASVRVLKERLGDAWDADLDDALYALLRKRTIEPYDAAAAIEHLGSRGEERALMWSYRRLKRSFATDQRKLELALVLAETIARLDPKGFWRHIRRTARSDPEWTKTLLARVAERGTPTEWSNRLESDQLGELFAILIDLFPPRQESEAERAGAVTVELEASFWRSRILEGLVARASPDAINVLSNLEQRFDDGGWIRRMRHRAHEELRRTSWAPPRPSEVMLLPSDDRRLLSDSHALQRFLIRMLNDLATEMRGAYPKAPLFWNTQPLQQPKSENELSDVLALLLRDKLGERRAFINREVQINAIKGSGDRTDLLIQALAEDGSSLAVVIEVKGAWNRDLMSAMSDQLAKKYLKPGLTEKGIYLVFWFSHADWDAEEKTDRDRRSRAIRSDASALQMIFDDQAKEVSRSSGVSISALVIDASLHASEG